MRVAFIVASLMLLAGCGHGDGLPMPSSGGVRAEMAAEAMNNLREAFNRGDCGSIYDNASGPFRRLESDLVWLARCEDLRKLMGAWVSSEIQVTDTPQDILLHANGTAVFEAEACQLESAWTIEDGQPRLFRLILRGPERDRLIVPQLDFRPKLR